MSYLNEKWRLGLNKALIGWGNMQWLKVAECSGPGYAAQIVREHNAHEALVASLEELEDYSGLTDRPDKAVYERARAALKLAKTGKA